MSENIVMQVSLPDVFVVHETRHVLSPAVLCHGLDLPWADLSTVFVVGCGIWRSVLLLVFLHVFEIALDLRLEGIEGVGGCLVSSCVQVAGLLLGCLLHEHLHVTEGELKPVWGRLLQVNSQGL